MSRRKKNWFSDEAEEVEEIQIDGTSQNGSDRETMPENGVSLFDMPDVGSQDMVISPGDNLGEPEPPPQEVALPVHKEVKLISVKVGYFDKIDNRYLVYNVDDISQAWLVDAPLLKNTVAVQQVSESVLGTQVTPYDWTEEILALIPDVNQVRLALWMSGLVSKKELNFKEVLAKSLLRGVVPIKGS